MRLINEKEMLAIAGGESGGDSGTTTTTTTNGTTTTTTSYANGTTSTVITRPDGHGTVITSTTTINGSGGASIGVETKGVKGHAGGHGSGGTSNHTTVTNFGIDDWSGFLRAY